MAKAKVKTDKTPVELLTAKQAKAEHARLQVEISEHDKRYYQQDRRPSPTPNTTRCAGATTQSKRAFPICARWNRCR